MVGEAGIEPTTPGLEGRCSIQLSYSPALSHCNFEAALLVGVQGRKNGIGKSGTTAPEALLLALSTGCCTACGKIGRDSQVLDAIRSHISTHRMTRSTRQFRSWNAMQAGRTALCNLTQPWAGKVHCWSLRGSRST